MVGGLRYLVEGDGTQAKKMDVHNADEEREKERERQSSRLKRHHVPEQPNSIACLSLKKENHPHC